MAKEYSSTLKAQYAVAQGDGTAKLEDDQIVTLCNREKFGKGDQGMVEYINDNWLFVLFEKATPEAEAPVAATQRVVVCGPNLNDQSKGQFHIHAEGCADLKKHARREPAYADGWTIEVASRQDIVTAIYPPSDFQYDPDTEWVDYDDVYIFACVQPLVEGASVEQPQQPEQPQVQTLHCKAGHDWTRPPARGRKPEYCPEHLPEPDAHAEPELQTLQCKAGHEWTRKPARGRQPEWCPEHRPQPAKPAAAVTQPPKPAQKTIAQPVEGDEENGPIVVMQPTLTLDQIMTQYHPDEETTRKLSYIDHELARGRASKDASSLLKTRNLLLSRLSRMSKQAMA